MKTMHGNRTKVPAVNIALKDGQLLLTSGPVTLRILSYPPLLGPTSTGTNPILARSSKNCRFMPASVTSVCNDKKFSVANTRPSYRFCE